MATNNLRLGGFIGTDPELRFSAKDVPWCTFRLAHPKRKKEGDKWVDAGTTWWDVKAFGKDAERIAELGKSCPIEVEGRLDMDEWNDRETGQKRTKPVILLDSWHLNQKAMVPMGDIERDNLRGITIGWKFAHRQHRAPTGPTEPTLLNTEPF